MDWKAGLIFDKEYETVRDKTFEIRGKDRERTDAR